MSLEQALLDRLEKRSLQVAQKENEIYGLRELVDEKMAINEQLAEQITTARLEREQMQHQITELRTECDRIREISKSLVPKAALKQAVQEAAELRSEVVKLRAEVPLESTREALKNAVANLRQHKSDIAKLYELADEIGRGTDESIADVMKRQGVRIAGLVTKLQDVTTDRDRLQNEIVRLNAKLGPLEKLYEVVKKHVDNGAIIDNRADIYDAVAETAKALSQLTA